MSVRRTGLLAVLVLLSAATGAAVTTYDIAVDGDTARVNATFELYVGEDESPVSYWRTSWRPPRNAEILTLKDSQGEIDEYTMENGVLRFETNRASPRRREVVTVQMRIDPLRIDEFRGVDRITMQLSGFQDRYPEHPDEMTQVSVTTQRELLAESHGFGFDFSLDDHAANYSGEGPINLYLSVGDGGEEYEHFTLFGEGNLSTADDLYWVPAAVTGFLPQVNSYPVVVYPDDEYDATVDQWSAGQYRTGGIIFIRKSALERDSGPGVVIHEAMHGFNEQAMRWTSAERTWFDEGTAKYVEWLVNANRSIPQAEIFGEPVTWREGNTRYTLNPRKRPEDLWDYYRSGEDYMRSWTLFDSSVDRTFGYAFSELVIRRYIQKNGPDVLRAVYSDLRALNRNLDTQVSTTTESNERILSIMGTDLRPCDADTESSVRQCLDRVNDMEPRIPDLGDLEGDVRRVPIEPIPEPDPGQGGIRFGNRSVVSDVTVDAWFDRFRRLFRAAVTAISGLF